MARGREVAAEHLATHHGVDSICEVCLLRIFLESVVRHAKYWWSIGVYV